MIYLRLIIGLSSAEQAAKLATKKGTFYGAKVQKIIGICKFFIKKNSIKNLTNSTAGRRQHRR